VHRVGRCRAPTACKAAAGPYAVASAGGPGDAVRV
jgi:hypothetical protein